MEDLYYIQNRGHCVACLVWWRIGGHGYTTNLDEAWKVPQRQALSICSDRPTEDFPVLASAVDALSERHISKHFENGLRA